MKLGKYVLDPTRVDYSATGLIVCEGFSDVMFVDAILQEHKITGFQVGCPTQRTEGVKKDGKGGIPDYLLAVYMHHSRPKLKGLLVLVDADTNAKQAFTQMRDAFTNAGFATPAKAGQIATGATGVTPSVAVFVVPGKGRRGCLEALLLRAAIKARPKMKGCLSRLMKCADHTSSWSENKKLKLQTQVVVATGCREDPCSSLSKVWVTKGNPFPIGSTVFQPIVDVIKTMDALP